jgi:hypothetical protein
MFWHLQIGQKALSQKGFSGMLPQVYLALAAAAPSVKGSSHNVSLVGHLCVPHTANDSDLTVDAFGQSLKDSVQDFISKLKYVELDSLLRAQVVMKPHLL